MRSALLHGLFMLAAAALASYVWIDRWTPHGDLPVLLDAGVDELTRAMYRWPSGETQVLREGEGKGRVYVASISVVLDTLQTDQRIRTRKFVSRVYRYARGPKYPGVLDVNMPGTASWHRDTTWVVFDGTGASSISDPRGIYWSRHGTHPLFIADRGNNQVKGVSSNQIGVSTVHRLTFEDGEALRRQSRSVRGVTGVVIGAGEVKYFNRKRNSTILGVSENFQEVRGLRAGQRVLRR